MTKDVALVQAKLNAVRKWETSTNVKEIQSSLGFTNYYQRFMQNNTRIAFPLTVLTKNDVVAIGVPYIVGNLEN